MEQETLQLVKTQASQSLNDMRERHLKEWEEVNNAAMADVSSTGAKDLFFSYQTPPSATSSNQSRNLTVTDAVNFNREILLSVQMMSKDNLKAMRRTYRTVLRELKDLINA